jgi:2-C-methyl-D-erythritol 4-phosphate cytidylyltransferase
LAEGEGRIEGLTDRPGQDELEGPSPPAVGTPGDAEPAVSPTRVVSLALGVLAAESLAAAHADPAARPSVGVVLPAGGQGLRAGGPEPKQFQPLRPGRPMLVYALETFHRMDRVKEIVLVLPPDRLSEFAPLAASHPKLKLVAGGAERWQSVKNGAEALDPALPVVAIHDVARPFVSEAVILRCLEAVSGAACVLAALPATDTVKEVDGHDVVRTVDRSRLALAQTPQVFPRAALKAMHAADWAGKAPTDEASMAEALGWKVKWVRGSEVNRKVTGPADLAWACWLAERLEAGETLPDG